ncbi:hypothetical protein MLD38_031240 [Melastoma candidum]|uniref:Uncharacterized protein n=1 Tax=Melastoma candidum TaxID=119954 RepID=A0ACB9MSM2_9MYRT|nr:hypothetical protein MLD38_031240 [Melastoma candidum]
MMSSPASFSFHALPNFVNTSVKFSPLRSSLYCNSTVKVPPFSRRRPPLRLLLEQSASSRRPPNRRFIEFLSQKAAVILLGSFIFMGFTASCRSLALSAKTGETRKENVAEREAERGDGMWERVLEGDPRNVEALKALLYGKMREGKMKEAVKYVEMLIEVEGKDVVEWRLLLGLCYETMGQLSTAKRIFREILEESPLLLRALHGLAMTMHKNHEGPAMFEMLSKALEQARHEKRVTEERNIRILIAQMHVIEGNLEDGLKECQDLVRENPGDFRPYLCQGIIYSLMNQKEEAQQQFDTYRDLVPEEIPHRGFLDKAMLAAKAKTREQQQPPKEYAAEFLNR